MPIKPLTASQTNTINSNRAHTAEITSWIAIKAGETEQKVTPRPFDPLPSTYTVNLTSEQFN